MQIMGAYKGVWGGGMDKSVENTSDAVEKQLQCIWQGSSKILWLQFRGRVGRRSHSSIILEPRDLC